MLDVVDELTAAGETASELQALVPLAEQGIRGEFATQLLSVLSEAALDAVSWPPVFEPAAITIDMPYDPGDMCGTPTPVFD